MFFPSTSRSSEAEPHIQSADPRNLPRQAGMLYLVIILCGISGNLVLRGPLLTATDPAQAMLGREMAFRFSLLADVVMLMADIALALTLFDMLRHLDIRLARAAMVFRLIQASVIAASLLFLAAMPALVAAGQMELAGLFFEIHATGYDLGLAFFAVTSFALARLLWVAPKAPSAIAVGLALAGFVYLGGSAVRLAAPDLVPVYEPAFIVPLVAELSFALWLIWRARISPVSPTRQADTGRFPAPQ